LKKLNEYFYIPAKMDQLFHVKLLLQFNFLSFSKPGKLSRNDSLILNKRFCTVNKEIKAFSFLQKTI